MASSLQALSNVIKNATTREQPARNVEDLKEEEEESEKEGNILTSTGNTKGAPTLTVTRTSSNGDLNVGGLRRSMRAASKTPADPNISKGATVPTPDPTEHFPNNEFMSFLILPEGEIVMLGNMLSSLEGRLVIILMFSLLDNNFISLAKNNHDNFSVAMADIAVLDKD
ncbi:hypothetical protein KEM48_002359 [Puccinia striiformis f. sp. tritici PST-130]|nr:hypothetical protein KEM48_002359 [Puccinia striiformis f. sp. tritici PST-130]